ncbi:TPA: hypothetical protein NIC12_003887 [Pseudomonas aeruginosa]|nr:hypothetical protein [Pseudomonas aeruginosa]HCF3505376.1 hypothetical protein [Pseudomonas aeruginosa]
MTESKICTCPSGEGSLRWPCPAHPAVEQAVGDERAAFEAAFAAMGRPVCRADYDQDAYGTPFDDGGWTGWQARAALAQPSPAQGVQEYSGYDQLWAWFGLSRSAYAVLPRVMMHAMPDDWQRRFAELMDEWDDHWPNQPDINARVHITQNGLYISTPKWLLDYRHPDHNQLNAMRGKDEL